MQTHKPWDGLILANRFCSTHMSLNGSSKSDEFLRCERIKAKANPRLSLPESLDGDTSMHQPSTGQINKEGCFHTALFHIRLLDGTAFFCQQVTNTHQRLAPFQNWVCFLWEGIPSSSPCPYRLSLKYPYNLPTSRGAKGSIQHPQKDLTWKWG